MAKRDGATDLNVLGPSDSLELVLELARRRFRRDRRRPTMRESQRLYSQAALEQLDYLLMEHWETLDRLARTPPGEEKAPARCVWRLRNGVLVEQSPSEALTTALELAERELREGKPSDVSAGDAVSWAQRFLNRYGAQLDVRFGRDYA